MNRDLLQFTDKGIYCPPAKVYLDPWRGVEKALISHAHSDHARAGSGAYLSHKDSEAILRLRLNKNLPLQTVKYNEPILINGVKFSFHPAGHIIGSSQIRVEYGGEVWVFSGDYKLENDGFSVPFEPVKCDVFITECTFGLPVYRWKPQQEIFESIQQWWKSNAAQGICSVIVGYSLGKAQRLLVNLNASIGPIYCHTAIANTHDALRDAGFQLPSTLKIDAKFSKGDYKNALIIVPPAASDSAWMKRFELYSVGVASGWMGIRGARRRSSVDRGFALSDHADWPSLIKAVKETGANRIIATHGYSAAFSKWLVEQGYQAHDARTEYSTETPEV
jgi:putative mRNA 3-end processing factor